MSPKISVIIPVYNSERFLHKCIDSIINQQIKDIEIILVNDGSSDNSGKICDEYADIDNRIRVLHIENQGVSNARNRGIELANGDYIGFVDADDWIDEAMYSDMLNNLMINKADIIMCAIVVYNGKNEHYVGFPWKQKNIFEFEEIYNYVIPSLLAPIDMYGDKQQTIMGSVCRCLFRKEVIKRNEIVFNTRIKYTEDLIFLLQFLIKSEKVLILHAPYYHYRKDIRYKTGTTQKYIPGLYSDLKRSNQHIREILSQIGYLEKLFMHVKWRSVSITITSIFNLCKKKSPYNFFERIQKAKYYISDSDFKKNTDKLPPFIFTLRKKIIVILINHSLVAVVLACCTLKNKIYFKY